MRRLRELFHPRTWRSVRPRLDPEAAALRIEHRTDPFETKLRIVVSLVVLTLAAGAAYLFREDWFAVYGACAFGFVALLNLLVAFLGAGFELDVSLRPGEVVYSSRWMGRTAAWREPLSRYRGVLLREEHVRRQSINTMESTETRHVIELVHDDPSKTIPLFFERDGPPPQREHLAFAERFRLPALSEDAGEEVDSAAARAPAEDPGPPPSGVRVETADGETRIVIGDSRRARWLVALFWGALPLCFGALAYQIEPMAGYLAAGMAILFIVMIFGVSRLLDGKRKNEHGAICLNDERVWVERPEMARPQWIETARTALVNAIAPDARTESLPLESMPRGAVARVRVDAYVSHDSHSAGGAPHARLLIEADEARLEYIGTQFDAKKLEWVRDYLRHRLAKEI